MKKMMGYAILSALGVALGVFVFFGHIYTPVAAPESADTISFLSSQSQQEPPPAGGQQVFYRNLEHRFSFQIPDGYHAYDIDKDSAGNTGVSVENKDGSDWLLVVMTPLVGDPHELTPEKIAGIVPDIQVADAQLVAVPEGYQGVLFKGNDTRFGGDSAEFWFPYEGVLYRLITSSNLNPLLETVWSTWRFY